jgi:hypothetical protein
MGTEVKVSDPVVSFRETTFGKSNQFYNQLSVEGDSLSPEFCIAVDDGSIRAGTKAKILGRQLADDFEWDVTEARNIHNPIPDEGVFGQREQLFLLLGNHPETICKSHGCCKHWYAGADTIDFQIYERIVLIHSKERTLQHFDGAAHYSFQCP